MLLLASDGIDGVFAQVLCNTSNIRRYIVIAYKVTQRCSVFSIRAPERVRALRWLIIVTCSSIHKPTDRVFQHF